VPLLALKPLVASMTSTVGDDVKLAERDPGAALRLLARYRPYLRYAEAEGFWADSVEMVFVSTGTRDAPDLTPNVLRREGGYVIASTQPRGSEAPLTAAFLDAETYGEGDHRVERGDLLDLGGKRGKFGPSRDYSADALFLRGLQGMADRAFGRLIVAGGRIWLQYWLFYYYNDKGGGLGRHECDWEVIQVALDSETGDPKAVTFSQHGHPEGRNWDDDGVEKGPDGLGVAAYVAYQSHANYFAKGRKEIHGLGPFSIEDYAPGDYPTLIRPTVVAIDGGSSWARWPGQWGADEAAIPILKLRKAGNSPMAPCLQKAWIDPAAFHNGTPLKKAAPRRGFVPPPSPSISDVRLEARTLSLQLAVPGVTPRRGRVPSQREGEVGAQREVTIVVRDRTDGPAYTRSLVASRPEDQVQLELPDAIGLPRSVQVALTDPNGRVSFSERRVLVDGY
jgi:hypothetical protein